MPNLTVKKSSGEMLLRLCFYGAEKTRKTWLAGTAAEAGFNVILLDGDQGYHILNNLPAEVQQRIQIFEVWNSLTEATFAHFAAQFLKKGNAFWNEKTRKVIKTYAGITAVEAPNTIQLNVERHLNSNTVLILDSWTALVYSIAFRYSIENKLDLTDPSKTDWDGYAWAGALATWMIEQLTKLPCHVIVIGHQTVYEKRSKDGKIVEWSRLQLKSTSNPHSMSLGEYFTDILYFENVSSIATKIDTRSNKDRAGGSRLIPPGSYNWEDLKFEKICKLVNVNLPPKDLPYLDFSMQIESPKNEIGTSTISKTPAKMILKSSIKPATSLK